MFVIAAMLCLSMAYATEVEPPQAVDDIPPGVSDTVPPVDTGELPPADGDFPSNVWIDYSEPFAYIIMALAMLNGIIAGNALWRNIL